MIGVFLILLFTNFLFIITLAEPSSAKCEPIRVDLCRGLGYNVTGMTNDLQAEADLTLQTFTPLIQFGCSAQLHFFLCSVYVPMCTEKVANPIGPCRSLCESVRARCYPVLQGFGFPWPAALNCSNFPKENNHENMCMEGPGEVGGVGSNGIIGTNGGGGGAGVGGISGAVNILTNPKLMQTSNTVGGFTSAQCPRLHVYVNRSGKCAPLCDADVFWDEAEKSLAEVWLQIWSTMCFTSSVLALLSFLVEPNRRRYPERPLAILALCYLLCAVGWGVRALAGRRAVGCQHEISDGGSGGGFGGSATSSDELLSGQLGHYGHVLLAQDGLTNPNCAVVFLLLYYFGMAANVWWVLLCLCWALAASRHWSHERLLTHSSLLHLIGWGLPAIQTVTVLVRRDVDADELTGICYVGNQDPDSLVLLVLMPQILYLILGLLCLIFGCVSLWSKPKTLPANMAAASQPLAAIPTNATTQQMLRTRNLQPPMKSSGFLKLGVFGALYSVSLACIIASEFHELWARQQWKNFGIPQPSMMHTLGPRTVVPVRPFLWVALLKIFMSLIIGVTAIAWVWSHKTLRAWQKMFRSVLGPAAGYKQPPVKCIPMPQTTPTVHYCTAPTLSATPSNTSRQASTKYSSVITHTTQSSYRNKPHRKHQKYSGSETIL